MALNPLSLISGVGGVANLLAGRSAANASKEAMRRQAQLLQLQNQTYKAAQPGYLAALAQYQQAAGLDPSHHTLAPTSGSQMGNAWGTQEDQLRFAAAQDQISKLAQQRQAQLQHTLANRGVASSSIGAALAQNQRSAMQDLAGFRRQLALDAPHEAERRRAAYLGALGPAFGQGAAASAGYGNQAAQFGQQANQAYAGLGGIVQNWQQQQALDKYSRLYGTHPGDISGGGSAMSQLGGMTGGGYGPGVGYTPPADQFGQTWYVDQNGEIQYY